ncbi:lasso peptide biosynthesis PqqD family chaperone [Actinoplanes sp. NPDC051411]|uniref:lasso peptide biosynthesis PqqD family chaperone n=1 Tax=Actinoplanes sp. NPDC051411 TaxID=3155522 RepID=UPI00343AADC5
MITTNPDVVLTRNDDGAVLLNKRSGRYYRLNPLGNEVFRLLAEGSGLEDIVADLRARFPDAGERIPDDVRRLVADLRRADLVLDR